MTTKKWFSWFAILTICTSLFFSDLDTDIKKGLAIFSIAAILWMTETIHLTATALLIPVLSIFLGVFQVNQALSSFAHPIIFIFLGGFALATALRINQLDQVIAHRILLYSKGHVILAVSMLFGMTALLSMWVSNTAVTALMLPLALGIIHSLQLKQGSTSVFVLLGIAYSASVGGMGSLIGSPPNAIVAASLDLTFADWFIIGFPIVLILLPIIIFSLFKILKPNLTGKVKITTQAPKAKPGSKLVIAIFIATACAWLLSNPIGNALGINSYVDAWIAVAAIVVLITCNRLDWDDIQKNTDWGVLLLFGGGLALGAVLKQTGTSAFIAEGFVDHLQDLPFLGFLLLLVLFVIFLTELTSNTATAALLLPLFLSISEQLDLPFDLIAMSIGFAASCAFMLPVATPPNAVVYGTGLVEQSQMMRVGFILNLISAACLPLLLYGFLATGS